MGSAHSVADPNIMLNTVVADVLAEFNRELDEVAPENMDAAVKELLTKTVKAHKRILFDGDNYTEDWLKEAEKRGLYNLKNTPAALPYIVKQENIDLFVRHKVLTENELKSRYEIQLEKYCKTIRIEDRTLQSMISHQFLPALMTYADKLSESIQRRKAVGSFGCESELEQLQLLTDAYNDIYKKLKKLKADTDTVEKMTDMQKAAEYYHDVILADMDDIRVSADEAEEYLPQSMMPYPTYEDLLFYV